MSILYTDQTGTVKQILGNGTTPDIGFIPISPGPSNVIRNVLPGSPLAASTAPNRYGDSHVSTSIFMGTISRY